MKNWIEEMDDTKLIEEASSLYESIYVVDCFGARDIMILDAMCAELKKRGYTINETTELHIGKDDDDEQE